RIRFEQALFARTALDRSGDRDAALRQLLPFLENNPKVFDVLQRPDWEELVQPGSIPEEGLRLLRGGTSPHTLSASSFPAKARQIESTKRTGLEAVKTAWAVFAVIAVVALGTALVIAVLRMTIVEAIVIVLILVICTSLLLPAVQQVREA